MDVCVHYTFADAHDASLKAMAYLQTGAVQLLDAMSRTLEGGRAAR